MNVLSSVLPGLRDLRVPLTVGTAWAIAAWLWIGPLDPAEFPAALVVQWTAFINTVPVPALYGISLVSLTLVGSLLVAASDRIWRLADALAMKLQGMSRKTSFPSLHTTRLRVQDSILGRAVGTNGHLNWFFRVVRSTLLWATNPLHSVAALFFGQRHESASVVGWLERHAAGAVNRGVSGEDLASRGAFTLAQMERLVPQTSAVRRTALSPTWHATDAFSTIGRLTTSPLDIRKQRVASIVNAVRRDVIDESFDLYVNRLRAEQHRLADEHDRLAAESQLRLAVSFPVALGTAALAHHSSGLVYLLLIIPILLWTHGSLLGRQAQETVWNALITGVVRSDIVEEIDRVTPSQALGGSA